MYMYIGLNFKLYRKGQQIETAFHIYIKVRFQNLFFRLSEFSYDKHVSTYAIN